MKEIKNVKLSIQDAKDLLVGVSILSTGGGGSLEKGLMLVDEDYRNGLAYCLVEEGEIDELGLYACPYYCGAIGPEDNPDDPYLRYEKLGGLETVAAVEALERFLGEGVAGIVSIEYGGMNTAIALSTAARMGKPTVDADAAGRAVPDLQFSTFYVADRPIAPLAVATEVGDCAVFEKVADDFRAEALVRALAVVSGNKVGMADHPTRGRDLKNSVIWGALSYAQAVGRAQREANEYGADPIAAIIAAAGGYLLFTGSVDGDSEWANEAGFTPGTIMIKGGGDFAGQSFKIWFKNENMMSWKNGEAYVTCPDLICVVDAKTGYPLINPGCKDGMGVAALGFKAPDVWRSGRGLSILNPGFFGFYETSWTPIEDMII
jgi:DUF917 family protein